MLRDYFENTIHFRCPECGRCFTQSFWQWLGTIMHFDITRHRYVKCPYCKTRHWLQAQKVK